MNFVGINVGFSQEFDLGYDICIHGCYIFTIGWFYIELIHRDCICQECKKLNCICDAPTYKD